MVKLRRSLVRAEEERSTMIGMVEDHGAEICRLCLVPEGERGRLSNAADGDGTIRDLKREVAWLPTRSPRRSHRILNARTRA